MASPTSWPITKDAIDLLTSDHAQVHKLFKQYQKLIKDKGSGTMKQDLAEIICKELTVHMALEEELFYPPVRRALKDDGMLDEAQVEHNSAKTLIWEIKSMDPKDDFYDAKVVVLCEYIEHHVKEEEEDMFPKVRAKSGFDLEEMSKKMILRKAELMEGKQSIMYIIKKSIGK